MAHYAPTVQTVLRHTLRRHRARPCLVWEGGEATYAETERRTSAVATWLQRNTQPEDRIAVLLPNGRAYLEIIIATALAGRVRVPLNPKESPASLLGKLAHATCAVLFTDDAELDAIGGPPPGIHHIVRVGESATSDYETVAASAVVPLAELDPSAVYRLSFTGGTTGTAKAVVQTHSRELAMIRNLMLETIRPGEDRTFVAATPLAHASGAFVLPTLIGGGSLSWLTSYDPERLVDATWLGKDIETFLVPTAMQDLTEVAGERGSHDVATIVYGGAPTSPDLLRRTVDIFGERLVQVYGQAEAPMTISVLPRWAHRDVDAVAGSAGWPFPHVSISVIGPDGTMLEDDRVGEVIVEAEHVMARYWQDSAESPLDEAGRLHTSDLGYVDEAGRLWLVGRNREIVITGGVNVYPDDVDRRLANVPGVRALASFGVPHPRWGESLVLAVVADGPEQAVREAVSEASSQRLGAYERPKQVVIVPELPRTDIGKISRSALGERFRDLFAESSATSTG